ncbi:MAG: YgaP family membrane protein [Bacillota bacterium]
MEVEQNVGLFDAYLRITGGLWLLACGIVRKSNLMIGLGAMKVAEGITGWCPLLQMLGLSTIPEGELCCCDDDFMDDIDDLEPADGSDLGPDPVH